MSEFNSQERSQSGRWGWGWGHWAGLQAAWEPRGWADAKERPPKPEGASLQGDTGLKDRGQNGLLCAVDGVGGRLSQERDGRGRNERGHETWRRCPLCKLARQQIASILGSLDKETACSE